MLICLLILCFFSCAEAKENPLKANASYPIPTYALQETPIGTQPYYPIIPKVNVASGEYFESACDLVIAGSEPISIRRYYNLNGSYHPCYAHWRFNPEHYCIANFEFKELTRFISFGRFNGGAVRLGYQRDHEFYFHPSEPFFINTETTGQNHPMNCQATYSQIHHDRKKDPSDRIEKTFFKWHVETVEGDGTRKKFCSHSKAWLTPTGVQNGIDHEARPKYDFYSPKVWTPYIIPVYEERRPSGNIYSYGYELYSRFYQLDTYPLINSITVFNSTKTKVLGFLTFKYLLGGSREIEGIEVTGSDGRTASYAIALDNNNPGPRRWLYSVCTPNQPKIQYGVTNVKRKQRHDERFFLTRVTSGGSIILDSKIRTDLMRIGSQSAPVGPNGEMCPIATYDYFVNDKATQVTDAENNLTVYRYDDKYRVTLFEAYDNQKALYRKDHYFWDPQTGNLLGKTTCSKDGTPLLVEEWKYDSRHNVIEEIIRQGNESHTLVKRSFSTDGFNLKLMESDDFGKNIRYSYIPDTNLLSSSFTLDGSQIKKRLFFFYDDCAICIKTIMDDGQNEDPNDLTGITFRKILEIKPKYSLPCFGLPEVVEEKTIDASGKEILLAKTAYTYTPFGKISREDHYDASNHYRFSISHEYDGAELHVGTVDALGQRTTRTYDANHNLLKISDPDGFFRQWVYDKAHRPIKEIDSLGTVKILKYNKLGKLISSTDELGFETTFTHDFLGRVTAIYYPDGGIEKKDYDELGNCIYEKDAIDGEIRKKYNFRNQVTWISYPDGTTESFTYRKDNKILSKIDKNGAKTLYEYDFLGNLIKEEIFSSTNERLKIRSWTYSSYNLLSETDFEGNVIAYAYDFAGRKTSETKGAKTIYYSYDELGRQKRITENETVCVFEYDLLNRITEKRTEDLTGKIYTKENYRYDFLGNQTHLVTSKGITETTYNQRKQPISKKDPFGHLTTFSYNYLEKTVITTYPNKTRKKVLLDCRKKELEVLLFDENGDEIQRSERSFDFKGLKTRSIEYQYEGKEVKDIINHQWVYNEAGQLIIFDEANKKLTRYEYQLGKLSKIIKPDGIELCHEYDAIGRLSRYFSEDFDYHYSYDRCDRLLEVIDKRTNCSTKRSYDLFGNVTSETLSNGLTLQNHYDDYGKRIAITYPDKSIASYCYNAGGIFKITRNQHSYTYLERNLEGSPTTIELPNDLGKIEIERDALNRWRLFTSPYYTAAFPDDAFDCMGNLCHYAFIDALGRMDAYFSYDNLNQLIKENDHTYRYDSLNNRIQKDETTYKFNSLCQIANKGFKYDLDGNLIALSEIFLKYDSQDRLIEVSKDHVKVVFTYDPFHRRQSKTVFEYGKKKKTVLYLWDGKDEIGATDENKWISELRILGEGLGAEIGSAVFIEIDGYAYLPIHDHRGSITSLIYIKKKYVYETYRFTAFGEQLTEASLLPWRFSSKRFDEETGFLYFGRRYYSPFLGRWITPDPQGFIDGPNLYAYVLNNPLTHFDLYGLRDAENRGVLALLFNLLTDKSHSNHQRDVQESLNSPRSYQTKGPAFNHLQVCNTNGMYNTMKEAVSNAEHISKLIGECAIDCVYNPTQGPLFDLIRCFGEVYLGKTSHVAKELHRKWDNFFENAPPNGIIVQIGHSEGTATIRGSLKTYQEDRRSRIIVLAVAPSKYIPPDLCMHSLHLVSKRDIVPYFDFKGRRECKENTILLDPHKEAPFFDHSLQSPTYEGKIKEILMEILEKFTEG